MKTNEITIKAILLALIITILLSASNAYLALKVGNTVAASIPAAVISLTFFSLFKKTNILESNQVQTAASASEGIASAAAYLLPALIILHYWKELPFWQSSLLLLVGSLLGVFFSIPLRRPLLNLKHLPFPEGTAVGNVLKAKAAGTGEIKKLTQGGLASAIVALFQTGFKIVSDHLPLWFNTGKTLFGYSLGFNPVLIGAGYIIGINASIALGIGSICGWVIGVPIMSHIYNTASQGGNPEVLVMNLWSQHIRYIGVGTLLVGGLWTLLSVSRLILQAFGTAITNLSKTARGITRTIVPRADKDMPIKFVFAGVIAGLSAAFLLIIIAIKQHHLSTSLTWDITIGLICVTFILVMGLITSIISGYIVGLVGSSVAPLSGLIILNILLLSIILYPLASATLDLSIHSNQQTISAFIIVIVAMIAAISAISIENIQDLKAGQMVGATPWKQQTMMILGAVAGSFVVPPIINLLFNAYGIGGVMPHPGMNPAEMLAAPQAGLVAALSQAFISHTMPWNLLLVGAIIGIFAVGLDIFLRIRYRRYLAVLAVGLGLYLPPETVSSLIIGGLIRYAVTRMLQQRTQKLFKVKRTMIIANCEQRSILLACGYVAGAAIMGVVLAIPFVIIGNSDALRLVPATFTPIANIIGIFVLILFGGWLYRTSKPKRIQNN